MYYRWRTSYNRQGPDGLASKYHKVDPEVIALEKENERLKKIISRQALELEIKEKLTKVDIPVILTPHSGHIDPPGVLVSKNEVG